MHFVRRAPDVDDPVVTPEQDAYLSAGRARMGMPDVGELGEDLGTPVQGLDDPERGGRLVGCDLVVDAAKPSLRLGGPD